MAANRFFIVRAAAFFAAVTLVIFWNSLAHAQLSLTPTSEMVLDSDALVLATGGNFSRVINGSPFQQETLITHGGYQYAAWYNNGADDENIFVSRRNLSGNVWETIDTGYGLENGDATASSAGRRWDSHNVISMGISGDGRIHLAYDHHVDQLRYLTTAPGVASSGGEWNSSIFADERSALNLGGSTIPQVTYPRFTNVGDDMVLTYRNRGSGNGDVRLSEYNSETGSWSSTRFVNRGDRGTYDDANNNPSSRRNAYHNGFHADSSGRLHTTWTWREGTQDGNHSINYAFSDDRGLTWQNNDGVLVGQNFGERFQVEIDSPVSIVDLDRRQSILNQQGQIVDPDGGVHAFMFHRRQEPGFEWEEGDGRFSHREDSAYHHYYRNPETGEWEVTQLPLEDGERVGSRPRMGVDGIGNLFALYTQNNDLVIVGAARTADGFADWEELYRDTRNFEGTPLIDNTRLLEEGILSVYLQDRAPTRSETEPTGSALRVMEFRVVSAIPEPAALPVLFAVSALLVNRRRRKL